MIILASTSCLLLAHVTNCAFDSTLKSLSCSSSYQPPILLYLFFLILRWFCFLVRPILYSAPTLSRDCALGLWVDSSSFPVISVYSLFLTSSYVQLSFLHNLHDPLSLFLFVPRYHSSWAPCCTSNEFLAAVGFLSMSMSLSHGQKQVV